MKKIVFIFLFISLAAILSGCTEEREYNNCIKSCDNIWGNKFNDPSSNFIPSDNLKQGQCKQICIEKYK